MGDTGTGEDVLHGNTAEQQEGRESVHDGLCKGAAVVLAGDELCSIPNDDVHGLVLNTKPISLVT